MSAASGASWIMRGLARYRRVLVFGLIGVCNTGVHTGSVVALVESGLASPVPANIIGFVIANTVSFFANCRFTFRQQPSWPLYRAFVGVSMVSLGLTIALAALAETMHWHYSIGLALIILVGPVLSYVLHKAVTFRQRD